jgi:hypothetical protein
MYKDIQESTNITQKCGQPPKLWTAEWRQETGTIPSTDR